MGYDRKSYEGLNNVDSEPTFQWNPNTGKEEVAYPSHKSIEEAIEDLAVTCLLNGVPAPTKIVFPKTTMDHIEGQIKSASWNFERRVPKNRIVNVTSAGVIDLVEHKPDDRDDIIQNSKESFAQLQKSNEYHLTVIGQKHDQIRELKEDIARRQRGEGGTK